MGECGTPVSGEDFVREPVKVLENVQMVWVDRMCFNSPEKGLGTRKQRLSLQVICFRIRPIGIRTLLSLSG